MIRARLPMSQFHPPAADLNWHTRDMWAWGGSRSAPRFDLFNLDYFQSVDRTIRTHREARARHRDDHGGLGLRVSLQPSHLVHGRVGGAMAAIPDRALRRIQLASGSGRRSTSTSTTRTATGTISRSADRWALRISRWIKSHRPARPHHLDAQWAAHSAVRRAVPRRPGSGGRDHVPGVGDARARRWLARRGNRGFDQVPRSRAGAAAPSSPNGATSEIPDFDLKVPHHEFCDRSHTRRSVVARHLLRARHYRRLREQLGAVDVLEEDLPGVADMVHVKRFFTKIVPFEELRPVEDAVRGTFAPGTKPLVLASASRDDRRDLFPDRRKRGSRRSARRRFGKAEWFDPRSGARKAAKVSVSEGRAQRHCAGRQGRGRPPARLGPGRAEVAEPWRGSSSSAAPVRSRRIPSRRALRPATRWPRSTAGSAQVRRPTTGSGTSSEIATTATRCPRPSPRSEPDVLIDFVCFEPAQAEAVAEVAKGRVGHLVFVSSVDAFGFPLLELPAPEDGATQSAGRQLRGEEAAMRGASPRPAGRRHAADDRAADVLDGAALRHRLLRCVVCHHDKSYPQRPAGRRPGRRAARASILAPRGTPAR